MFSRIIPLQEDPERHPFWRKAVKFGATCTTVPSEAVTHVIAYVNGTEKVCCPIRKPFKQCGNVCCRYAVAPLQHSTTGISALLFTLYLLSLEVVEGSTVLSALMYVFPVLPVLATLDTNVW